MWKLSTDLKQFEQDWDRVLDVARRGTVKAAQHAHDEAGERVITFLIDSVYNTAPGNVYARTEAALNGVGADLIPVRTGDFVLQVRSDVGYAAQIEQGNQLDYFQQQQDPGGGWVPQVSLDELVSLMESVGDTLGAASIHPRLFFDRSGQNYQEPGPHVIPAAVVGAYVFAEGVEDAWTQASKLP